MSRVPDLDPEKLSPEQRKVYDAIVAGPRGRVVGPLRVWLQSPELADRAQALGAFCRFGTSLPPRLSELAILVTAAH
jgi:4-carboxymuconolactone decarboxylase